LLLCIIICLTGCKTHAIYLLYLAMTADKRFNNYLLFVYYTEKYLKNESPYTTPQKHHLRDGYIKTDVCELDPTNCEGECKGEHCFSTITLY